MAISTGRIDVHTHLLPGIDDGCPTYEESIRCAAILTEAGYTHAFCTPHIWPTLPNNTVDSIKPKVAELQQRLDDANVDLQVLPGGELNLLWTWPGLSKLQPDHLITYNQERRYLLFDFWSDRSADCMTCLTEAIHYLRDLNIELILGHPERITALTSDPAALDRISDMGVLLQMNTWCLTEPKGTPIYDTAERLLKSGRYFCFGTDLHNSASMPTRIQGISIAEELVGKEEVDRLTIHNPRKLLPGEWGGQDRAARGRAEMTAPTAAG